MSDPAIFLGSTTGMRTMADGSLRVQIDFNPADMVDAVKAFGAPGSPVFVGRSTNEAALEHDRPKDEKPGKGEYGQYAKSLKQSSFFRMPEVWREIGTDDQYLEWLRAQPSALNGDFDYDSDTGEGRCVPAHVRRSGEAGTAYKPPYSAIPLTNAQHQLQHQKGESEIGGPDWWGRMRIKYVSDWCWETLKQDLGFNSWADVPPEVLRDWAKEHDLVQYLPGIYRSGTNTETSEGDSEDGCQFENSGQPY